MDWKNYTADYVRTATVDGRRLVLDFAKDFQQKFNYEICISCIAKFQTDFNKYIYAMSEINSEYRLKPKYNNIPLGFGKRGRLSNENMNDKDALFLIKNHPRGVELFDKIPKVEPVKVEIETVEPAKPKKTRTKRSGN